MAFELCHRLLEQLAIQIEADHHDVATLRCAENAARAANLQIAHGDAKTRAERAVLLDGTDSSARSADGHHFSREHEIRVSLVLGSTYASAQLVQIGQAKPVCAIDDDRVRIWDVETTFDNRRANKHIDFSSNESRHYSLQFSRIHLAVASFHPCLWTKVHNPVARTLDCLHTIVQEENLPAAFQLSIDRIADDSFIISRDHRFHWQTIQRRCLNRGHILCADE